MAHVVSHATLSTTCYVKIECVRVSFVSFVPTKRKELPPNVVKRQFFEELEKDRNLVNVFLSNSSSFLFSFIIFFRSIMCVCVCVEMQFLLRRCGALFSLSEVEKEVARLAWLGLAQVRIQVDGKEENLQEAGRYRRLKKKNFLSLTHHQ